MPFIDEEWYGESKQASLSFPVMITRQWMVRVEEPTPENVITSFQKVHHFACACTESAPASSACSYVISR